jgi:hypothetical protein
MDKDQLCTKDLKTKCNANMYGDNDTLDNVCTFCQFGRPILIQDSDDDESEDVCKKRNKRDRTSDSETAIDDEKTEYKHTDDDDTQFRQSLYINTDGDDDPVCNIAIDGARGLNIFCKTYESITCDIKIPQPKPEALKQLASFWKGCSKVPLNTTDTPFAYGEPLDGTLYKLWYSLKTFVKPSSHDVLLDWGMGAGKMLISKHFLSDQPEMKSVGVEISNVIYERAKINIKKAGMENVNGLNLDSATLSTDDWEKQKVSIVVQYDGPATKYLQENHRSVIVNLLRSKYVRAIFSTKMNPSLFCDYDHTHFADTLFGKVWKFVCLKNLKFGNSTYQGYLWIKTRK